MNSLRRDFPVPTRFEDTAEAMTAVGDATDSELATWDREELACADRLIAGLERVATTWDTVPRADLGHKLWHTNHRFLTDALALRARIRPHLAAALP